MRRGQPNRVTDYVQDVTLARTPPTPQQRRAARLVCAGYALTQAAPAAALTELLGALGLHPTYDQEER